jgi:hypothetical protein
VATFTIVLKTDARKRPPSPSFEDVAERARIQQALLGIVSSVSNNRVYDGAIGCEGIKGEFHYYVTEE